MARAEKYDDLIFQLADLARERLADKPGSPRSMDRVFKAEDAVVARREELAALEQQMNDEDQAYQDFLAQREAERREQEQIVRQFKRAVDAIQGRVKDLRKKIAAARAQLRYEQVNIRQAEARVADLEMTGAGEGRIEQARAFLRKMRLGTLRNQRDLEEMECTAEQLLTPRPDQPGAQGVLAHKRLLEIEDELETRKARLDARMPELDRQIALKEEEVRASEDDLDQALFLLGEECYALRLDDPALAPFYPRIDRAR